VNEIVEEKKAELTLRHVLAPAGNDLCLEGALADMSLLEQHPQDVQ